MKKEKKKIIETKKGVEKLGKSANEFKAFISRGNVVDMAVGVIVGSAFGKIVTSLVNDLLMPLIGVIIGGLNFSNLSFNVGDASIAYGNFIQTIIDFLIISVCIFAMVKLFEKFKITKDEINIKTYQIEGAKIITNINGKEYEYAPPTNEANLTRTLSDDFTIKLSDRA